MARLIVTITHEGDEYALLQLAEVRQQPQESHLEDLVLCEEVHLDVEVGSVLELDRFYPHDLEVLGRLPQPVLEVPVCLLLGGYIESRVIEGSGPSEFQKILVVLLALVLRLIVFTRLNHIGQHRLVIAQEPIEQSLTVDAACGRSSLQLPLLGPL